MIPDTRVAVLGLGLMGGSVARALAAQGARVLGHDRNLEHVEAAQREGVVHEVLDSTLRGIETADVVLLALPVDATIRALVQLAARLPAARLVMDVASTKASIVQAAEAAGLGAVFCGAHPLTGSHRAGWGASRASLFADARASSSAPRRRRHPRRSGSPSRSGGRCVPAPSSSTPRVTTTRWPGGATCRTSSPMPSP